MNVDEGTDNKALVIHQEELDCGEFPVSFHSVRAIIENDADMRIRGNTYQSSNAQAPMGQALINLHSEILMFT